MQFHSTQAWSKPFKFACGKDNPAVIARWGCRDSAGIYLFTDEYDEQALYVGKAENTSKDISDRLQTHVKGEGNRGLAERVLRGETFTIRWAVCQRPSLSESIAIVQLLPLLNERSEWAIDNPSRIDGVTPSVDVCIRESQRLGFLSSYADVYDTFVINLCERLGW